MDRLHTFKSVLIVEDDTIASKMIKSVLEEDGIRDCKISESISKTFDILLETYPELFIIDLNLPDGNGVEILKYLRKTSMFSSTPVIILTGESKFVFKKQVFENGADVYLSKPIDYNELCLWIRSLYRRAKEYAHYNKEADIASDGEIEIDRNLFSVRFKGKSITGITDREFSLLFALVKDYPKIFSRKEIIEKVWKTVSVENLVDIHMHNLRKKLPQKLSERIKSVHGKGFRWSVEK